MSAVDYLLGVLWLGAVGGALGFGAVRVRRRALPRYEGATARLAEITLALGVFVLVPELLGAVGQFRRVPVLLALVAVGVGAGLVAGRPPSVTGEAADEAADEPAAAAPAPGRLARLVRTVAVVLAAAAFAQWTGHVVATYTSSSAGIWDGDSLWYHLPFATKFLQTGWVTRPLFTNADTLVTYFPANSEVVLGLFLMPFRRDIAVPVVNLGWVLLSFLAAWSFGKRYGAPAVALGATAVAVSLPVMAATQGGTARNDMMGVALFLSACALLAHARWERNGLLVAGTAAGLALGVKLSTVIPVAILVVAVLVAAPRGRRWQVWWPWSLSVVGFGGFWYVRNLVLVGNPIPTTEIPLGPVTLPSVFAESTAGTAVVDRLRQSGAVGSILRPGLDLGFGPVWWLVLALAVVVPIVVCIRAPDRVARTLAIVAIVGALAYVVMPNGSPGGGLAVAITVNFALNLRYLLPALALGLCLTAALPRMRDPRFAAGALGVFTVVTVSSITDTTLHGGWEWAVSSGQRLVAAVLVALVLLVVGGVAFALRGAPWSRIAVGVGAGLLVVVVVGGVVQQVYLDRRYRAPRDGLPISALFPWADDLPATRIGLVGTVVQYPLVGSRLATTVRYVGVPRDDGGFRTVRTCEEFRDRLRAGGFRYVVTAIEFFGSNAAEIEKVNEWTRTIDGARVVRDTGPVTLYELSRPPDPRACP